ncbi:LOW QUALITY PROTEIN: leucine-rich repeat-containing protein 9 [Chlamydotis macqueenii]
MLPAKVAADLRFSGCSGNHRKSCGGHRGLDDAAGAPGSGRLRGLGAAAAAAVAVSPLALITQYSCNGSFYMNIDQEVKTIAQEMFFSGYPRLVGMKYFPNITTLILTGQSIQKISDLEYCLLLKELWIAECCLGKIHGLQKCVNLQKLYLYCNEIYRTENQEALTKLNVLNLNGSSLSKLQDISRLKTIQKLIISFNEYTSLNNIYDLPNWEYFDANHSHVISLEGIRGLSKFQCFNLCWNKLKKSREDKNILHKPTLTSLDITHNPYKPASFRLTVIGQLTAFTNLDGVLIANEEAAEALQYIAGSKMTQAGLKLSQSTTEYQYEKQKRAKLQSWCYQFRNVHSVNLQNNNLMSFSGLIFLPNAKVLCLNYNHIESMLPAQKLPNQVTNRQQLYKVASHGYGQ